MFEKLLDFLTGFIDLFKFATLIEPYERGVVTRLGVYNRTLEPGFHWIWPFAIENVLTDGVVTRVNGGSSQSLQTLDGKAVTVTTMIRWSIKDIKKALLEVEDIDSAYRDISYTRIATAVGTHTLEQIKHPDFHEVLTRECRKAGHRYGIEVEEARFTDLAPTKNITLFNQK